MASAQKYSLEDDRDVRGALESLKVVDMRHSEDLMELVEGNRGLKLAFWFTRLTLQYNVGAYSRILEVFWGAVVFFFLFSGWQQFGDYICFVYIPGVTAPYTGTYCSTFDFVALNATDCSVINCTLVSGLIESCDPSSFIDSTSMMPFVALTIPRLRNLMLTTAIPLVLLSFQVVFTIHVNHSSFNSSDPSTFHLAWLSYFALALSCMGVLLWISSWLNVAGAPLCSIPFHLRLIVMAFFWMFVFTCVMAAVAYTAINMHPYFRRRMLAKCPPEHQQPKGSAANLAANAVLTKDIIEID